MKRISRLIAGAGFLLAAMGGTGVLAQTTQGTTINNVATVNFTVNGSAQVICSGPTANNTLLTGGQTCQANGTPTYFKVDTKVDVVVTNGSVQTVQPNGTAVNVTTFLITNQGNVAQDFVLTATGLATGASANGGPTALVDTTGMSCAITGVTPAASFGSFTQATGVLTQLKVGAGNQATATVQCTVPATNGTTQWASTAIGGVKLKAQAVKAGTTTAMATASGTAIAGSGGGTDGTGVVLADVAGPYTGDDGANDGAYTNRNTFKISAPVVTVTKSVAVLCDPVSGFTSPKFIPGAYVQYTVTVANTGTGSAILSSNAVVDALQNSMTLDANLIKTGGACASTGTSTFGANQAVGVVYTGSGGVTQGSAAGQRNVPTSLTYGTIYSAGTVTVPQSVLPASASGATYVVGELKATESLVFTFNAIIP